jgi:hypothetical protein
MGEVQHGNSPHHPILEKKPQSDVLGYFKGLMTSSRIGGWMQHVYGHADKYLLEAEMSPAQRVNCRADKLATAALIAAAQWKQMILPQLSSRRKNSMWKSLGNGSWDPKKRNHGALRRTSSTGTV